MAGLSLSSTTLLLQVLLIAWREVVKAELSGAEDFGQSRGRKNLKELFIKWSSGSLADF
jgi:hypothetical protein